MSLIVYTTRRTSRIQDQKVNRDIRNVSSVPPLLERLEAMFAIHKWNRLHRSVFIHSKGTKPYKVKNREAKPCSSSRHAWIKWNTFAFYDDVGYSNLLVVTILFVVWGVDSMVFDLDERIIWGEEEEIIGFLLVLLLCNLAYYKTTEKCYNVEK